MRYCHRGQGATEYLVLLAVVLVIALAAIALLGFFPGMAGDAQVTQSEMYWKSATPIAVFDASTKYYSDGSGSLSCVNILIRNTGSHTIKISKILGGNANITNYRDDPGGFVTHSLTDIQLAPGEETCFSGSACGSCSKHAVWIGTATSYISHPIVLAGASTICNPVRGGQLLVRNFGFEYIEIIEGLQMAKRQVGKDFVVKCST